MTVLMNKSQHKRLKRDQETRQIREMKKATGIPVKVLRKAFPTQAELREFKRKAIEKKARQEKKRGE